MTDLEKELKYLRDENAQLLLKHAETVLKLGETINELTEQINSLKNNPRRLYRSKAFYQAALKVDTDRAVNTYLTERAKTTKLHDITDPYSYTKVLRSEVGHFRYKTRYAGSIDFAVAEALGFIFPTVEDGNYIYVQNHYLQDMLRTKLIL